MKRALLVSSLTYLVALSALGQTWPQEPTGFRGLPWGASLADARKAFPDGVVPPMGHTLDVRSFEVGTTRVSLSLLFEGVGGLDTNILGGGLFFVAMNFPRSSLAEMTKIFVEKYGQPTGHYVEGGHRVSVWKGKTVKVEIGSLNNQEAQATMEVMAVEKERDRISAERAAKQKAEEREKKKRAKDAF